MASNLLFRSASTLTRSLRQAITYTPEGAVSIAYSDLKSSPLSLSASIEEAFGSHPKSLGLIIVRDLPPSYPILRERVLRLGYHFAKLDAPVREKYADPTTRYSFGWSHGKEIMNGKPDLLKGSYYANPTVDDPKVTQQDRENNPEYYGKNICKLQVPHDLHLCLSHNNPGPAKDEKGIEGFEEAFKDLGRFIFQVGCELAKACQPFASSHLSDAAVSLPELIRTSQTTKARLLHYFPPAPGTVAMADDEPVDSWCGFHLDHSLLTGLCSAMYLEDLGAGEPRIVPPPSSASGLYIRTRGGDLTKVSIPAGCLAFQTGEALEIATDGRLRATPHCVRVGSSDNADKVSRETFVLFMQPDTQQRLSSSRTFGQFTKEVLDEHYGNSSM